MQLHIKKLYYVDVLTRFYSDETMQFAEKQHNLMLKSTHPLYVHLHIKAFHPPLPPPPPPMSYQRRQILQFLLLINYFLVCWFSVKNMRQSNAISIIWWPIWTCSQQKNPCPRSQDIYCFDNAFFAHHFSIYTEFVCSMLIPLHFY